MDNLVMTIEKKTKQNEVINNTNIVELPKFQELKNSLEFQDIDDDFENIVDIRCFNIKDIEYNSRNKKQEKQLEINKNNTKKKVTFNDNVQIKFVDNYIKDMDKILLSKNDFISALNIIKIAIFRKTFRGNEIKIVVDLHNRLNNIINSINSEK